MKHLYEDAREQTKSSVLINLSRFSFCVREGPIRSICFQVIQILSIYIGKVCRGHSRIVNGIAAIDGVPKSTVTKKGE